MPENDRTRTTRGRQLDPTRDAAILDATLDVLAEVGYTGMKIEMVAERAKAGKGTLYRRWPSKEELVIEAVTRMGQRDVGAEQLPDTGTLRGDIIALIRPELMEEQSQKVRVIAGLTSMLASHEGLAESANNANIGAWITANRVLIQRAVDRGEAKADADVDFLARLIPSMSAHRIALEGKALDKDFLVKLVDEVLLPALR
ncbi:TetR/AcrR family transcriptional regulator [Winogradskya humida]|uniref:TetR family transcriptional regulator n=1 Tax=Winogradskya humida TaxID=113566 RepID=A0ABQ3ZWQ3_9ACTN|nr:TetR/AcrR family transcriptional regulator [Actinoplanes humidus]GIE22947.1 TetR family transcriptional regulator [Actinoplanes humidus]